MKKFNGIRVAPRVFRTALEPHVARYKGHDEMWFPNTPLGHKLAERLKKSGWKQIEKEMQ